MGYPWVGKRIMPAFLFHRTFENTMELSFAQFEPLVGADFTVDTSHGQFSMKLAEAQALPRRGLPEHLRTPFSLTFERPPGVVLARDNYLVGHPAIGQHVLYVVPVAAGPGVVEPAQYQIVFN
jgi:hypothetical protein